MRCDCGREATKLTGAELYPWLDHLAKRIFWRCDTCDAQTGCHPHGETPIGPLVSREVRRARHRVHLRWDPWLKDLSRRGKGQMYRALERELGVKFTQGAHFGAMGLDGLRDVWRALNRMEASGEIASIRAEFRRDSNKETV